MTVNVPRRVSQALLNSLSAGVVPRIGPEHIAVGRGDEISALLGDLENVMAGGAAFRLIIGRYGSGKTFLLRLLSNHALARNFIVTDADLAPERRLAGTNGQGVGTYRELVKNLSTKARPDGGALSSILERWISTLQSDVARGGVQPEDPSFQQAVEARIFEVTQEMHGLVSGFDFAKVIIAYWRGHVLDDAPLRDAALRWLRGEFATKTEARSALDVRVIIDDSNWYDHIKLLAHFASQVGYKGLLVIIDETVNLYRIVNSVGRESNYEKMLAMFNDTMQGRVEHLGLFFGGTPQLLEDHRRGLFSYEALRSRLSETRFHQDGWRDTSGPVLRLQTLTQEEIFVLLQRIAEVHGAHHRTPNELTPRDYQIFMRETLDRLGSDTLQTPRPLIRDFISVLNIMQQHPGVSLAHVLHGSDFKPASDDHDLEAAKDEFAEFTL